MTAEKLLAIARAELGTAESPAGSNRTKYGAWYGLDGQPWCMIFVQWCFAQAGASALLPVKTASCGALTRAAQKAGQWVTGGYQPGDVVIYDFPGGAATDHCGIVESVSGGSVTAIEGNTSEAGSQSNGGQVCRKTRALSLVVGAFRARFWTAHAADNLPAPAHREGVEWAVAGGILTGNGQGDLLLSQPVTRQQLCTMLLRYEQMRGRQQ